MKNFLIVFLFFLWANITFADTYESKTFDCSNFVYDNTATSQDLIYPNHCIYKEDYSGINYYTAYFNFYTNTWSWIGQIYSINFHKTIYAQFYWWFSQNVTFWSWDILTFWTGAFYKNWVKINDYVAWYNVMSYFWHDLSTYSPFDNTYYTINKPIIEECSISNTWTLNIVEYKTIFNSEDELQDIFILQTVFGFILLFTLIMAKIFITKTRG